MTESLGSGVASLRSAVRSPISTQSIPSSLSPLCIDASRVANRIIVNNVTAELQTALARIHERGGNISHDTTHPKAGTHWRAAQGIG